MRQLLVRGSIVAVLAFNVRPGDCFDITGFESLPSETEIEDIVIECLASRS